MQPSETGFGRQQSGAGQNLNTFKQERGMQNLKTYLTPLVGSSNLTSPSGRDRHSLERTKAMFGCYRRGEANDPEIYTASVAAVLAEYPPDIIDYVTDPRTGLPSQCDFLPTVKEVRAACEKAMAPQREAMAREQQQRRQTAERRETERAEEQRAGRPSYEELVKRCADVGLHIGGKRMAPIEPEEKVIERLGITKEQWDSIPKRGE